jgi:hypothetical protein
VLKWPHEVKTYTRSEVTGAIFYADWQDFRLSLKGVETVRKLKLLDARRTSLINSGLWTRDREIQIDNYINALKRGGQLNMNLEVVK